MADIEQALADHDRLIKAAGITIWLGAEPTFTDQRSSTEEWRTSALGSQKESKARKFLQHLVSKSPGAILLRTLGRQYPGETKPRWSLGLYARRDGTPIWSGPPDPMACANSAESEPGTGKQRDRPHSTNARQRITIGRRQVHELCAALTLPSQPHDAVAEVC
ncbi:MAG: transglutaminase-like family protein [Nitrospira sp.]|nr:transglutaminase-like family protein [Nitrospira sp.]